MKDLRRYIRGIRLEYAESFEDLPNIWKDWFKENEEELELKWIPNKGFERRAQTQKEKEGRYETDIRDGRYILHPRELPGGGMLEMGWGFDNHPLYGHVDPEDPSKYWKLRREEGRKLKQRWAKETYEPNKEFFDNLHYVTWIREGVGTQKIQYMESLLSSSEKNSEIPTMFFDEEPFFFSEAMWLGAIITGRPTFMANRNINTGNRQKIKDDNVEGSDDFLWFLSKERFTASGNNKYPTLGFKNRDDKFKQAMIWKPEDVDYKKIRNMRTPEGGNNEAIVDNWDIEALIMTSYTPPTAV